MALVVRGDNDSFVPVIPIGRSCDASGNRYDVFVQADVQAGGRHPRSSVAKRGAPGSPDMRRAAQGPRPHLIGDTMPVHVLDLAWGVCRRLRRPATTFQDDNAQPGAGEFADDGRVRRPAAGDADLRLRSVLKRYGTLFWAMQLEPMIRRCR